VLSVVCRFRDRQGALYALTEAAETTPIVRAGAHCKTTTLIDNEQRRNNLLLTMQPTCHTMRN